MTTKKTLTVETPRGTFTRKTARTYTHIVLIGEASDAAIRESNARNHAHFMKEIARERKSIANAVNGRVPNPYAGHITYSVAEVEERIAGLEKGAARHAPEAVEASLKARAGQPAGTWVAGWCGRLDLAQKLADQERRNGRMNVEVVPVDPA